MISIKIFHNMNFNPGLLADMASPSQIPILFQQWIRLEGLLGKEKAFLLMHDLLKSHNLQLLIQMSDQDIKQNYHYQPISITGEKKYSINEMKKQSKQQIQYYEVDENMPLLSQTKYKNKLQSPLMNNQNQHFLNQKSKTKSINPEQMDNVHRIKKQLQLCLKQYSSFISFNSRKIQELLQLALNYKKQCKILSVYQISQRASKLKKTPFNQSKEITMAYLNIVDSALYHSSRKHRLRQTQILAILFFLSGQRYRILLQILTGQGKSTTISCLAAILAIIGLSVDIVTTNQLLATRDVDQKQQFYNLLGLEVAHNFQENQRGPKQCYQNNKIVYGTPHTFQVDILFNDYKKRQTRCGRPFEVLIVDEVDSMFVDQKDHQTLLSTTYPGFSELIYPMKIIWNKISTWPMFKEDGKFKLIIPMGQNNTVTGEVKQIMVQIIKDIRKQFKNEIIPQWRQGFIDQSIEKWVHNAIVAAFVYKENQHYLVKNGTIVPIDYKNTGSLQQNVHWENGLHQFLQIKHGLNVSTQGMTSNFISNLGHFDKYKQLYGLTGTLGSDQSKSFLKQTYKTELFKIPPYKQRRLKIQYGQVLYDQAKWADYIVDEIQMMISCERSVLVLCQTIQEVQLLKIALQNKRVRPNRIQELKTGDETFNDQIDCGELILATNLAGRGTDLKVSQLLNQRGGLHVIISFMPSNLRVQMQGRGRAGRNGYDGSSQLAINYQKYCHQRGMQPEQKIIFQNTHLSRPQFLCKVRDHLQQDMMKSDRDRVKQLRSKDRVFNMYCKAVNEIPDFQTNSAKQKALEEQWAMFLKRVDNQKLDYQLIQDEAVLLTNKLKTNSDSFYNPNHLVQRGINKLFQNNNNQAISLFAQAQRNNIGSLPQIIGGTYEGVCKINQDKQNKQTIQTNLNKLSAVQNTIIQRNQMKQGLKINDLENNKVTQFHHQQLKKIQRDFSERINNNNIEFQPQRQMRAQISMRNESNKPISKPQINQSHLQSGQQRILNGLSKQIDQIKKTYQNLGKNQYVQIDLQPISKILDTIEGDPKENKEALQKLAGQGLRLLPVPVIKKKKVSWWKRITVFLLGVLQIVCGAIILASTGGALTGFGVTMMMEGAKYCFDSIFRPEVLDDLKKYFTDTALRYTFALAASGMQGIKQLATLSSNGFKMMTNMPFNQFLSATFNNIGTGMKMFPGALFSMEGGKNLLISHGLALGASRILQNKNKRPDINMDNPINIIKQNSPEIKKKIDNICKQEGQKDIKTDKVVSSFQQQMTGIIKSLTRRLQNTLVAQIKNLPLQPAFLMELIKGGIGQNLKLPEGSSPQASQLLKIFTTNLQNPSNLSVKYCEHIRLQYMINKILRDLKSNKNYQIWLCYSIRTLIKQAIDQTANKKKQIINTKKQAIEQLFSSITQSLPVQVYNNKVQQYKTQQAVFNNQVDTFNLFLKDIQNNSKTIYETLKAKNAIEPSGRLKKEVINGLSIHPYFKQTLLNLKYTDSSSNFQETLQSAIYNVVVNYGIKIIGKIIQSSGGVSARVDQIAKLIKI